MNRIKKSIYKLTKKKINFKQIIFILFLFFFSLAVYTFAVKRNEDKYLLEKADRISESIINDNRFFFISSAALSNKLNFNQYTEDNDIQEIIIKNTFDEIIFTHSKKYNNLEENINYSKKIKYNNYYFGLIQMKMADSSLINAAEKISDLIISENLDYLWEYDIPAIKNSLLKHFSNENIEQISVAEESGIQIANFIKKPIKSDKIQLRKKFIKNNRELGFLDITVVNRHAVIRKNQFIIFTLLSVFFTVSFIFNTIYNKINDDNYQDINWKISPTTQKKLKKALEFIHNNYLQEISREGLAAYININADNFGRFFKIYTNEKLNDYINRLRIEKAKSLISDTSDSIVDIAHKVGFDSLSTFSRIFRKITKVTPTVYRKKNSVKNISDSL